MKKKTSEKDCMDFGTFTPSERCDKCSRNLECLEETLSSEICFREAQWGPPEMGKNFGKTPGLQCRNTCYDEALKNRCSLFFFIKFKQKTICKNYGHPKVSKECVICNSFEECVALEICISNLGITLEEAKDIIRDQKEAFKESSTDNLREDGEEEECFGKFSFKECWDGECEFKIECLREVGIIPDGSCIHFPLSEDLDLAKICSSCLFKEDCLFLWKNKKIEVEHKKKMEKIYNKNLSVETLRGLLVEE